MKALDTKYNGILFRSRLEARWAVFMDSLNIRYIYEPEAYDLDGLFYLPDFWLPSLESFLEIKPIPPTKEESEKAERLVAHTQKTVFILIGFPECPLSEHQSYAEKIDWIETEEGEWKEVQEIGECLPEGFPPSTLPIFVPNGKISKHTAWDEPYLWCECASCGRVELQWSGKSCRIQCECDAQQNGGIGRGDEHGNNFDSPRLRAAYTKARSCRFDRQSSVGNSNGKLICDFPVWNERRQMVK